MNDDGWLDAGSSDLEDGVPHSRLVGGHMVMVLRQGETLHATDAVCPHKFTMLADGTLGDGCITCPMHEATFDLTTGLAGEDTSWSGRLPVHEVRVDGERLMVRLASHHSLL